MAVNQPPITGNEILDSWLLEVTRELNSGQRFEGLNLSTTNAGRISVDNYVQLLSSTTREYTFTDSDRYGPIVDRSLVFIGGLKLVESVDYTVTGTNQITLTSIPPDIDSDSMIELTVWSVI